MKTERKKEVGGRERRKDDETKRRHGVLEKRKTGSTQKIRRKNGKLVEKGRRKNGKLLRRKKQIHQVSEYVEKRIERKKDKDNEINGRRRKVPQHKNGVCQILYPHETQCPTRINNHELDNEIRINQWSDCCEDSTRWKPEIHQIPRCRSRGRRINAKMAVKKTHRNDCEQS